MVQKGLANNLVINTLGSFQDQNRQAGKDFCFICLLFLERDTGVYSTGVLSFFSSNILVTLILMCSTVVSSSPVVCSFSSVWLNCIQGEKILLSNAGHHWKTLDLTVHEYTISDS